MKCVAVQPAVSRRGTIFHYYLIYVLLTSTLLIVAGVCMHTILKADHQDEQISRQLRSLLRIQQTLRQDVSRAKKASLDADRLVLSTDDNTEIEWEVDQNIVTREVIQNQSRFAVERFVFRAGTDVDLESGSELLTLRLIDPPFVKQANSAEPGQTEGSAAGSRKAVEIIVQTPTAGGVE